LVLSLCHESPLFQVDSVRTRGLGGVLVCFWQDCPPVFVFAGGPFPDQPPSFLSLGGIMVHLHLGMNYVLFLFSLLSFRRCVFISLLALFFPSSLDPRLVSLSLFWEAWDGRFCLWASDRLVDPFLCFPLWEVRLGLKLFSWRHSTAGVLNCVHAFSGAF